MRTSTLLLIAGGLVAAGVIYAATRPAALAADNCTAALQSIPEDVRSIVLDGLRAADASLPGTWAELVAAVPGLPADRRASVCNAAVRLAENLRGRL